MYGRLKYMNSSVCIEQKGIIESADNNLIRIRIDRESACGHCNARGFPVKAGRNEPMINSQTNPKEVLRA